VQPTAKKTYDFHPLANTFPRMSKAEFKALVDDIRANGLLQPIVLYQTRILDGRHRYDAAKEAKVELTEKDFTEFTGNDPLKFVISQNLHRRHLNETQRAVIAAQIAKLQKGANQHTKEDGPNDPSISEAAKMLNVSPNSVKRARNVLEKAAPELVERVRDGTLRVGKVNKKVLALPKDQQQNAVDAKKPELPASTKLADKTTKLANSLIDALKKMDKDARTTTATNIIKLLKAVA
jgi:ParB-like chromosome segregation protein Spo0J